MEYSTISTTLFVLSIIKLQAIPQLVSNIGSDLSGNYCPGNITLICNALDFGSSGIIDWYIDDSLIARYNYRVEHQFPFLVTTGSSILNATVQISSLTQSNHRFTYSNFTLSMDLNNLLNFQGQAITCGTFIQRSNNFNINYFVIKEGELDVSYLAIYQGVEGTLDELYIQWRDIFWTLNCSVTTLYTIQVVESNGITSVQTLSTEDCIETQCSAKFSFALKKSSESYTIYIIAENYHDTYSSMLILGSRSHIIQNKGCDGLVNVSCPSSAQEKCSLNLTNMGGSVILMPGETYTITFEEGYHDIDVTTHNDTTTIIQKLDVNNLCAVSTTYIHLIWSPLLVAVLIISGIIVICIIIKLKCKKGKTNRNKISELPDRIAKRKKNVVMKKNESYDPAPGNKSDAVIEMKSNRVYELTREGNEGVIKQGEAIEMKSNRVYGFTKEGSTAAIETKHNRVYGLRKKKAVNKQDETTFMKPNEFYDIKSKKITKTQDDDCQKNYYTAI